MDVVNGKIVSARTDRSKSVIWGALKPSCDVLVEGSGPNSHGKPDRPPRSFNPSLRHGFRDYHDVPDAFQPGWKRSPSCQAVPSGRDRHHHRPCKSLSESSALFDEEMAMYESHVSRVMVSHVHCFDASVASPGSTSVDGKELTCPATADKQGLQTPGAGTNPLKRPRMEPHFGIDQVDGPWIAPLRYLFHKVMSVSDVGELGRIVLPKKDAEGQLPQIDTKGKQLEMKDYSFSKSWFFHYKWWVNSKSQMYVLENTGEFIKYHGLKANDSFFVYEDGCGNLVSS